MRVTWNGGRDEPSGCRHHGGVLMVDEYNVFLSHNPADKAAVEEIAA